MSLCLADLLLCREFTKILCYRIVSYWPPGGAGRMDPKGDRPMAKDRGNRPPRRDRHGVPDLAARVRAGCDRLHAKGCN